MPGRETGAGADGTARDLRWANLTLAFLLELCALGCALGALGYWGLKTGEELFAKTALGLGAPLVAAVLWGMFAAPRAPVSAPALGLAVKLTVFGSAALALYATGHGLLAPALALVAVVNGLLRLI